MKETIGIIGVGFVGSTVKKCFELCEDVNIETYDVVLESTCNNLETLCEISDYLWVCVPTPMNEHGSCNTNIVESVIRDIHNCNYRGIIIIKSTTIVGTTEKLIERYPLLNIVYNPEFLTEANSVYDFMNTHCIYMGGKLENCEKVETLYNKLFQNFVPFYISEDTNLIEMVKYTANSFLAVKVGFFNEMYQICEKKGINYGELVKTMMYDDRIGKTHMKVPGPDGKLGFGGSCFPKDLNALFQKIGYIIYWKSLVKQDLNETINALSMASLFSQE